MQRLGLSIIEEEALLKVQPVEISLECGKLFFFRFGNIEYGYSFGSEIFRQPECSICQVGLAICWE